MSAEDRGDAQPMLAWIGRHGVATIENLSVRFALTERTVASALRRAGAAGLVRATGSFRLGRALFTLTPAGLDAAGLSHMRVCPVAARAEAHLRTAANAAVWLERSLAPWCHVFSERELQSRPRGSLDVRIRRGAAYVHHGGGAYKRPDLLVVPRSSLDGLPLAVEIELSCKSAASLHAICTAWKHCEAIAGALYLAAPRVREPLRRAIERAGAQRRVVVLALDECELPSHRTSVFAPTFEARERSARRKPRTPFGGPRKSCA